MNRSFALHTRFFALYVFILLTFLFTLSGCSPAAPREKPVRRDFFSMDTYVKTVLYGKQAERAADALQAEMLRLDKLLSSYNETSEISQLQKKAAATLSEDTAALLTVSLNLHK